jgi:hypothetical protein
MKPNPLVAGTVIMALGVAVAGDHAEPHTLANTFATAYAITSTGAGVSDVMMTIFPERLIYSEAIDFLRDTVSEYTPINPVTFSLP